MNSTETAVWVALASFLVGAIHVLTPDHWLPGSLLAWQRGWGMRKSGGFSCLIFALHVSLGSAVFFASLPFLKSVEAGVAFRDLLAIALLGILFRSLRFSRGGGINQMARTGLWGTLGVLTLLGPSESLLPVLMKSRQHGAGYLIPISIYFVGTVFSGTLSLMFARFAWNRPQWLPRGLGMLGRRRMVVPFAATLAVGAGFFLLRVR